MQKKLLEAMPLAMLPTKSRQHCQDQMIRANIDATKTERSISIFHPFPLNGWLYSILLLFHKSNEFIKKVSEIRVLCCSQRLPTLQQNMLCVMYVYQAFQQTRKNLKVLSFRDDSEDSKFSQPINISPIQCRSRAKSMVIDQKIQERL